MDALHPRVGVTESLNLGGGGAFFLRYIFWGKPYRTDECRNLILKVFGARPKSHVKGFSPQSRPLFKTIFMFQEESKNRVSPRVDI